MAGPPKITVSTVSNYNLEWKDKGSGADMDGAFYDPLVPAGWYMVGSYGQGNYANPVGPSFIIQVTNDDADNPVLAAPTGFDLIWKDSGSGADKDGSFWRPIAPAGYVALGHVATRGHGSPNVPDYRCLRADLASQGRVGTLIWRDKGSGADKDVAIWQIMDSNGLPTNTFISQGDYDKPESTVFTLQKVINS